MCEFFIDRSTHLRNLFSAVGNNEIYNKMALWIGHKRFVETLYTSGGFCVAVE
jgi:hypothetical protein